MGAVGFAANEIDGRVADQVNGIRVIGRQDRLGVGQRFRVRTGGEPIIAQETSVL